MNVAIQGIPGSFHHQVALQNFGEEAHILPFLSFEQVSSQAINRNFSRL
jgi:prephenate dehydratase